MKKDLTEIVFILDRSGSMSGLEADTIGGFNSLIARQKKEAGQALVSTVLFDDRTLIWAHHNKEIKVEYLLTDINRTIANRKSSDLVGRAFLI